MDDLFAEFSDSGIERLILGAEHLNLGLQVIEPLLLSLATLESRDTRNKVSRCPILDKKSLGLNTPITLQEVLPLLFVG